MLALAFLELTIREIITDIPHDFGALIAYTLMVALIAFIGFGSRPGRATTPTQGEDATSIDRDR